MSRTATINRKTAETKIALTVNLDGAGHLAAETGVGFLDHMLAHLAKHSLIDISLQAAGDLHVDDHHTVEDIAICLAEAVRKSLSDKAGIRRYGSALVPMDEALARVAIDLSGRGHFVYDVRFGSAKIGTFDTQLVEEFLGRFAVVAGINLHVTALYGANDHHIAEAIFKAVGIALRQAKQLDPDRAGQVPSTKGTL